MRWPKVHILFFISMAWWATNSISVAYAQQDNIRIELSETTLELKDRFSITVYVRETSYEVDGFPNINGFTKGSVSVAHVPYRERRKRGVEHVITQSYQPTRLGNFKLNNFTLLINGTENLVNGTTIRVVNDKLNPTTEVEQPKLPSKAAKEDALLAISASKSKIFVGEGIEVEVGFYVSDANTVGWDFPPNLAALVEEMGQKLKPNNSLESRKTITNVTPEKTTVAGKSYTRYVLFSSIYYPLDATPLAFSTVSLPMTRLDPKGRPNGTRTFSANAVNVEVKDLPEHPLKNKVAVGDFSLTEKLHTKSLQTGTSFTYTVKVVGKGNFTTINIQPPADEAGLEVFPPRVFNRVPVGSDRGEKQFDFPVLAKEAGEYDFKQLFQLVYFNTVKANYDTLHPSTVLQVTGPTVASEQGKKVSIYDGIEELDSSVIATDYRRFANLVANILLITMVVILLFLLVTNRKV